jgi:hypothetical protein
MLKVKHAYVGIQEITHLVYLVELLDVLRAHKVALYATAESWQKLHYQGFRPQLVTLLERVKIVEGSLLLINGPQREGAFVHSVLESGHSAVVIDPFDYPKVCKELMFYLGRISGNLCEELARKAKAHYMEADTDHLLFG